MPCPPGTIPAPLVEHLRTLSRPQPSPHPLQLFEVPQTKLCLRAEAFVSDWLPVWAANHCFRTYAFAIAIAEYAGWTTGAQAKNLGFDKELVFLSCALHEMGFDLKSGVKSRLSLEIWGAIKAREWILGQGDAFMESEGRCHNDLIEWADEACEAIARHTIEFRGFSSRVRVTGALVTLGAGQDLMGLSSAFIHPEDVTTICGKWPRAGYCDGLRAHAILEVSNKPACLFEDCVGAFDPGMYSISCFEGLQGELTEDSGWQLRRDLVTFS